MTDFADQIANLSPKRLALLAYELHDELEALQQARAEPIAIVGLGCRFPGGADSPASFWELLRAGVDAVRQVPAERWDVQAYYDPDPDAPGKMTTRYGAFLERVDTFDAEFFGIAPREARRMDPQQRLLLEVAWEALEHANLPPDQLAGSAAGVFIGVCGTDYARWQFANPEQLDAYAGSGIAHSIVANRLSYLLDLQGPSIAVDTACSSSLVTVHLACQSLRARECDLALAGGVNLILSPEASITFSRARMLASDGRCKTFDARADGYVRGEGCGVVVLKRLSDALRDGDAIWAVVRGSAVNQDGKSNGLTAPNVLAQEAVLRAALAAAQVRAGSVGYIEAHGTGTALGDPIEVQALSAVYGQPRADGAACWLGSVKTNLGHLEGAAGIAGLIKAVLALRHGAIPAHLHFHTLNPSISLSGTPFLIPTATTAWPATSEPRRAGVSAFGFGGTNAHVILEEAPALPAVTVGAGEPAGAQVLTLSAQTAGALRELAARTAQRLRELDGREWAGAAASSHQGRRAFGQRLALVANSAGAAAERLARWAASGAAGVQSQSAPRVAYVFPGQGVSLAGVGRELAERYDVFRDTLAGCAAVLQAELGADLRDVLWAEDGTALAARRAETAFVQPALVAVEWALSAQLRAWGLRPSVVLGHSVGEYTAAMVAGALDWQDGLRLAAARGRLMQALPAGGGMLGLEAGEAWVGELLARLGSPAVIAAVNGPSRVVVAGDVDELAAVEQACRGAGVSSQRLGVGHGFHSPLMRPMVGAYRQILESVAYRAAQAPIVSGAWGRVVAAGESLDVEYWAGQVERPVRYGDGVAALKALGCDVVVEVGPGGQLSGLGQLAWGDGDAASWVTMRRGKGDECEELLGAVGALWAAGVDVDWRALDGPGWRRIALPTYPFQRERYWVDGPADGPGSNGAGAQREHPLSLSAQPWLGAHRVFGRPVVPGAYWVQLALAAVAGPDHYLEEMRFEQPLELADDAMRSVQVRLEKDSSQQQAVTIHSRGADGTWTRYASGKLTAGAVARPEAVDIAGQQARCPAPIDVAGFYAAAGAAGLALGPDFQWLAAAWRGADGLLAQIAAPGGDIVADDHPGILDAALQAAALLAAERDGGLVLPVAIERVVTWPGGAPAWVQAERTAAGRLDARVLDETGQVVWELTGVGLAPAGSLAPAIPLAGVRWVALPTEPPAGQTPTAQKETVAMWWLVGDAPDDPFAAAVGQALTEEGYFATILSADDAAARLKIGEGSDLAGLVLLSGLAVHEPSPSGLRTLLGLELVQSLLGQANAPRLWLVSAGGQAAGPLAPTPRPLQALRGGLATGLAQEQPGLRATTLDLDPDLPLAAQAWALAARLVSGGPAGEPVQALRGGAWLAPRLEPIGPVVRPARVARPRTGNLDEVRLEPLARVVPGLGQVEVEVVAAGLNFRDALNALGELPGGGEALGGECAGRIVAVGEGVRGLALGQRVVALAAGSLATHVVVDAALVAALPDGVPWASAAGLPIAALTARLALGEVAQLQAGQTVLIHAAAGGVGQAALAFARAAGAVVVGTAGSAAKRALVAGLGAAAVADSREPGSYAVAVAAATGGRGVDVVVNALSGAAIKASLALLAPGGLFIELGKRGIWSAADVAAVRGDVRYVVVDLAARLAAEPGVVGGWLRELMGDVATGQVRPLPVRTWSLSEAGSALRVLAGGQGQGKQVLVARAGGEELIVRRDGRYLITGGHGAVGLAAAEWLAGQGAGQVVLLSRRGRAQTPAGNETIARLRAGGVDVEEVAGDVADAQVLAGIGRGVRGVVHAAGVSGEGLLGRQADETVLGVLGPKVMGAWALEQALAGERLDWWLNCSSAAGLVGVSGQVAYGAANAVLDAQAAGRAAVGAAGLSVAWGPIGGGGMGTRAGAGVRAGWAAAGVGEIPLAAVGPTLAAAWARGQGVVAALAWRAGGRANLPGLPNVLSLLIAPTRDSRERDGLSASSDKRPEPEFISALLAMPAPERARRLIVVLQDAAGAVLGQAAGHVVDPQRPLRELGLDSLLAVELRNRLARLLGQPLPATLLFDYPTLSVLASHLLSDVLRLSETELASPTAAGPLEQTRNLSEPIAIIGLGCRFPGAADTPEAYWQLLRDGVDAITEVPPERWDVDAYYSPDPEAPGKMNTRWGAFLSGIDQFDAAFFGISPREAAAMDPQQRLLLEVAWEALERAGLAPASLSGSQTGVFVGLSTTDYAQRQQRSPNLDQIDAYIGTGSSSSVAAGRLSYVLGLQGPSLAVDTACSSSLVAVHLACQSLRSGECRLALAGGVNVILNPEGTVYFSKLRAMAADGRCKTFDARADGYVRGEGCGLVVLKRLSDALRDGDPIWAVVRGSAVNQDGRSNGLTAPNGPAQTAVIRAALAQAGVAAASVGYVEAHGTGTALGDPIEVQALAAALGAGRTMEQPLLVGSVKTNLGHLEAAAGMAGLIKTVLALRAGQVPAHLHFETPSPHIAWETLAIAVPTATLDWPGGTGPRRAGVSAFGLSGTNAHVVLEQAPEAASPSEPDAGPYLIVVSARTTTALRDHAADYAAWLAGRTESGLAELAAAAGAGRSHFAQRAAIVVPDAAAALAALNALAAPAPGESHPALQTGQVPVGAANPGVVFVCAGQGGQWPGMLAALRVDPVAKSVLERVAQAAAGQGFDLRTLLADPAAGWLDRIEQLQPLLFALQLALAARLAAWGIRPAAVVGHSCGEVAAAYLVGALSLDDAVRVIVARSRALAARRGQGTMAVVELDEAAARAAVERQGLGVSVAGVNGPRSTVVSGSEPAIAALREAWQAQGIFCRALAVDVAAHSAQLDELLAGLGVELAGVTPQTGPVPYYSTVTGQRLDGQRLDGDYWVNNLRAPVQLWGALQSLVADGQRVFVELSPHPTHVSGLSDGLRALGVGEQVWGSLRRGQGLRASLLPVVGGLYCAGVDVDWRALAGSPTAAVTSLPTYPFQRERFWIDMPEASIVHIPRPSAKPTRGAGLSLGQRLDLAGLDGIAIWQQDLEAETFEILADHRVDGTVVVPAAAYLEWMLSAARQALGAENITLEQVRFAQMLALAANGARRVQVILQTIDAGTTVSISSRLLSAGPGGAPSAWILHAVADIRKDSPEAAPEAITAAAIADIHARCASSVMGAEFYAALARHGLDYGPHFQRVKEIHHRDGEALASLEIEATARGLQPSAITTLLDAGFQVLGVTQPLDGREAAAYLPVGLGRLRVLRPLEDARWAYVRRAYASDPEEVAGDVTLYDVEGRPLLEVSGLRARRLTIQRERLAGPLDHLLYELKWIEAPPLSAGDRFSPGTWVILADRSGRGAALGAGLEAKGARCVLVFAGGQAAPQPPGAYQLNSDEPQEFRRVLRAITVGQAPCRGIIDLWALDAEGEPGAARDQASVSVLHLVQAVAQMGWRDAPRLWLVTRGAQAVSSEQRAINPAQATVWGVGRTVALEHPALRCTLVDLDPASMAEEAAALGELLQADGAEDALARRADHWYVPRLSHTSAPEIQTAIRPDGIYLITGGLGGIGLAVARWLVEQGARHLVLVGRSDPSPAARAILDELRGRGAVVVTVRADVSQREQIAALLSQVDQTMPPLCGILHAAGILDDSVLTQLTAARLRAVLAPKVDGAWHLHELTRDRPLDFFVLFSSAAAVLGAPGQANYAAGNAFLDALAHHRRAAGLPGLSINWGPWGEVGLAAAKDNRGQRLALQGIDSLTPAQGLQTLGALLSQPLAQIMVAALNLRQWREVHLAAADAPLLADLMRAAPSQAAAPGADLSVLESIRGAERGQRRARLGAHIREQVAQVMRLKPTELDPNTPFGSLGLDSLMGLEVRNRLERSLGLTLSAALVWTYPTVTTLAAFLAEALELADKAAPAATPVPTRSGNGMAETRAEIAELSEAEAERQLLEELARLTDRNSKDA